MTGPVAVRAPGPKGVGGSGLPGGPISDTDHHGGDDQALYAYAREDLDGWETELGRRLAGGTLWENLTTAGVDVSGAFTALTTQPEPPPLLRDGPQLPAEGRAAVARRLRASPVVPPLGR